jgi:RNA polymerase-binding transcription factor DksA
MVPPSPSYSSTIALSHDPAPSERGWRNRQAKLRAELTKQRAVFKERAHISRLAEMTSEIQPDSIDHASSDFEHKLATQARTRTMDRLHRIDPTLQLKQPDDYGRCYRLLCLLPYTTQVTQTTICT